MVSAKQASRWVLSEPVVGTGNRSSARDRCQCFFVIRHPPGSRATVVGDDDVAITPPADRRRGRFGELHESTIIDVGRYSRGTGEVNGVMGVLSLVRRGGGGAATRKRERFARPRTSNVTWPSVVAVARSAPARLARETDGREGGPCLAHVMLIVSCWPWQLTII